MAQDFTQKYGIYCEETFAPINQLTCACSLLVITATCHQFLFQIDVKNAFLNFNGNVIKAIYMQPPPSLEHPLHIVYRLQKALYGLKEAPQAWFTKFNTTISHPASPPILITLSSFFISQIRSLAFICQGTQNIYISTALNCSILALIAISSVLRSLLLMIPTISFKQNVPDHLSCGSHWLQAF